MSREHNWRTQGVMTRWSISGKIENQISWLAPSSQTFPLRLSTPYNPHPFSVNINLYQYYHIILYYITLYYIINIMHISESSLYHVISIRMIKSKEVILMRKHFLVFTKKTSVCVDWYNGPKNHQHNCTASHQGIIESWTRKNIFSVKFFRFLLNGLSYDIKIAFNNVVLCIYD